MKKENVEIAALCDCDENRMNAAAADCEKDTGKKPLMQADYRKLLEDKSIDAVSLASPNHWHALQMIWACQAGKDVYCEKPASHNISEGRKMVDAARKYKRIVQHGTQCRTSPKIIEGMQKLKVAELKPLGAYLESPSPGTLLVMLYSGKLKKTTSSHLKAASNISVSIRDQDIPLWLTETAKRKGITMSREAVEQLIGIVGTETGLLSSEVEKLAVYGRENIDKNDINELVKGFGDYSAFDLINALEKKDAAKVFRLYASISETQEPYALLGALNWHYSKLKPGTAAGSDKREKIFSLLNEADFMVKSSGGAYPLEHLFSQLLRI